MTVDQTTFVFASLVFLEVKDRMVVSIARTETKINLGARFNHSSTGTTCDSKGNSFSLAIFVSFWILVLPKLFSVDGLPYILRKWDSDLK